MYFFQNGPYYILCNEKTLLHWKNLYSCWNVFALYCTASEICTLNQINLTDLPISLHNLPTLFRNSVRGQRGRLNISTSQKYMSFFNTKTPFIQIFNKNSLRTRAEQTFKHWKLPICCFIHWKLLWISSFNLVDG